MSEGPSGYAQALAALREAGASFVLVGVGGINFYARTPAEAFATGSSFFVMPVVEIDGHILGNRAPGPLANRLRELYVEMASG